MRRTHGNNARIQRNGPCSAGVSCWLTAAQPHSHTATRASECMRRSGTRSAGATNRVHDMFVAVLQQATGRNSSGACHPRRSARATKQTRNETPTRASECMRRTGTQPADATNRVHDMLVAVIQPATRRADHSHRQSSTHAEREPPTPHAGMGMQKPPGVAPERIRHAPLV